MSKQQEQPIFVKINDAVKITGLPAYYLRKGCKSGEIPHINSGRVMYVNIPALMQQNGLNQQQ